MARGEVTCVRRLASRGFTYLWVLLIIAALGAGAGATVQVWTIAGQREREAELLFVGEQYARAIASYVAADATRTYPKSFEELLADRRLPVVRRHLRRLYRDPMTGGSEWGIVRVAGGIAGVYSRSQARPMKRAGFKERHAHFAEASTLADWKFTAEAGAAGAPTRSGGGLPSAGPSGPAGPPVDIFPGTPPVPQVAAPAAPSAPVPVVQPKPAAKNTARTAAERQCRLMARGDVTSCAAIRANRGDAAGMRCEQSAAARAATCVEANAFEGALPSLVTE